MSEVVTHTPDVLTDTPDGLTAPAALAQTISEMIGHRDYPCLGARSVLRRGRATVRVYHRLADPATAPSPLVDLQEFASMIDPAEGFASFVAIFRGPPTMTNYRRRGPAPRLQWRSPSATRSRCAPTASVKGGRLDSWSVTA